MSEATHKSGAEILYEWLQMFAGTANTYRTYFREFERIQTWLLLEELDFCDVAADDLGRYLEELGAGLLNPFSGGNPRRLGERTLSQSRGILIRMFEVLQSNGLRGDNPARRLVLPASAPVQHIDLVQTCMASERWREVRQVWVEQPEPEIGIRDPLARIVVVAEWSYWTALRRSELAELNMANVERHGTEWQVTVPRFGRADTVDRVHVPGPAVEALRRYRVSRGLSQFPSASEVDVPLIAQLRTETRVEPWTIGHILREASRLATPELGREAEQCQLSNRELRRYLIADGLIQRVPYLDLCSHVRSRYAASSLADASVKPTIAESLARLVAVGPR